MDNIQLIPQTMPSAPLSSSAGLATSTSVPSARDTAAASVRGAKFLAVLQTQIEESQPTATDKATTEAAAPPPPLALSLAISSAGTSSLNPDAATAVEAAFNASLSSTLKALVAPSTSLVPTAPQQTLSPVPENNAILFATLQLKVQPQTVDTSSSSSVTTQQKEIISKEEHEKTDDTSNTSDWVEGAAMSFATHAPTLLVCPPHAPTVAEETTGSKTSASASEGEGENEISTQQKNSTTPAASIAVGLDKNPNLQSRRVNLNAIAASQNSVHAQASSTRPAQSTARESATPNSNAAQTFHVEETAENTSNLTPVSTPGTSKSQSVSIPASSTSKIEGTPAPASTPAKAQYTPIDSMQSVKTTALNTSPQNNPSVDSKTERPDETMNSILRQMQPVTQSQTSASDAPKDNEVQINVLNNTLKTSAMPASTLNKPVEKTSTTSPADALTTANNFTLTQPTENSPAFTFQNIQSIHPVHAASPIVSGEAVENLESSATVQHSAGLTINTPPSVPSVPAVPAIPAPAASISQRESDLPILGSTLRVKTTQETDSARDTHVETAHFESIRRDLDLAYGQSSEKIQNLTQSSLFQAEERSVVNSALNGLNGLPARQDLQKLTEFSSLSSENIAISDTNSSSSTDSLATLSRGESGISTDKLGTSSTSRTEESSSTPAPSRSSQIREILELLPKPLRRADIEIRTETMGTLRVRITPFQGTDSSSWRIEIRASDPTAQSLLSLSSGELRQHLKAESVSFQGSTLSFTTTAGLEPREDGNAQQRQGRQQQTYEPDAQQRNDRRKQEWFDLNGTSGNTAASKNGNIGKGVKRS